MKQGGDLHVSACNFKALTLIIIIIINFICNAPFLNSKRYNIYNKITNQPKLHNIKIESQ